MSRETVDGALRPVPSSSIRQDVSTLYTLVPPSTSPEPTRVWVQAQGGTVYWRDDGSSPSDTTPAGGQIAAGNDLFLVFEETSVLKLKGGAGSFAEIHWYY